MKLFAHVHTAFFDPVIHLNIVKESSSNNGEGIVRPALRNGVLSTDLLFMIVKFMGTWQGEN